MLVMKEFSALLRKLKLDFLPGSGISLFSFVFKVSFLHGFFSTPSFFSTPFLPDTPFLLDTRFLIDTLSLLDKPSLFDTP